MARVLFVWELGAGLGHLIPIKEMLEPFLRDKHEVFLALSDLSKAHNIFDGLPVTLLQAPFRHGAILNPIPHTLTFGHILHNNGFGSSNELHGLVSAWKALYSLVKPDLALYDHSPTALLASQHMGFARVHIGTGFTSPPCEKPFGVFFPEVMTDKAAKHIEETEQAVLDVGNEVLKRLELPLMNQLSDLYDNLDESCLYSYPDFDHFKSRDESIYHGVAPYEGGVEPQWPKAQGPKIFIYLKPFKYLTTILSALTKIESSVIFYSNEINKGVLQQYQAPHISYVSDPQNLDAITKECDFSIINGNHSTLVQLLFNAIPVLMIPLHREQRLLSMRMQERGVGLIGERENPKHLVDCINKMLAPNNYKANAQKIADKYKDSDVGKLKNKMYEKLKPYLEAK